MLRMPPPLLGNIRIVSFLLSNLQCPAFLGILHAADKASACCNTVCTAAGSFASGARVNFTLNVTAPNVQGQPTLTFSATVGATATNDPLSVNNSAGRTLLVTGAPVTIPGGSGAGG